MTVAPSSNLPVSVDYTGRDYYSIREQLIQRVQARVKDWKGSDPSDFGLALVEAFSYMGDLVNYYIDRVANESFILTATQRESLLNLAAMYGYKPTNYVSASTTLSLTSNIGYSGQIGGAIIENGTVSGGATDNYMKLIVPNNHPFTTSAPHNHAVIASMPTTTSGYIGGSAISYNTSVFNGDFPVLYVGYNGFGNNVIWIRPSASISTITSSDATNFTITLSETNRTLLPIAGQKIEVKGATLTSGATLHNYNGRWVIDSVVDATSSTGTQIKVKTDADDTVAIIGKAVVQGSALRYSAWTTAPSVDFVVGETVTITGIKSSANTGGTAGDGYNQSDAPVTAVQNIVGQVSGAKVTGSGPYTVEYRLSQSLAVGDFVTFREIQSATNTSGGDDVEYNITDYQVSAVATETAIINDITGMDVNGVDNNGLGLIKYQTSTDHTFKVGDFVTMTNIVDAKTGDSAAPTNVYNLVNAKILAIDPDGTPQRHFVVNGNWSNTFDHGASVNPTATLYKAQISHASANTWTTPATTNTGGFISRYFEIDKGSVTPGTWSTPSDTQKAVAQVGGTYDTANTADEVVYAPLPVIVTSGPTVTELGNTTLPAGSQVSTQVVVDGVTTDIIFSTQSDAVIPYRSTLSGVLAIHGEDISLRVENLAADSFMGHDDISGELLGYSTGAADQAMVLKESQVPTSSVRVFVDNGIAWEEWSQVNYIQDHGPLEKVFQVSVNAASEVSVMFGDGISGYIPVQGSAVKTKYITGGGVTGNVSAGSLTTWNNVLGTDAELIKANVTVSNDFDATGGTDPETNDSIRFNAPRALRALNRAVTLQDFSDLALSVDGIAKSNSVGKTRSSVTVYVAPFSSGTNDLYPGYDATGDNETVEMVRYITQVQAVLSQKCQIGTTITVLPPTYSNVKVEATYSTLPSYNPAVIGVSIKQAITDKFNYSSTQFGEVITPEEVEFQLRQVEGVAAVKVTGLYRPTSDNATGRNTLVAADDELLVFTGGNINLTQASSDADITGLTVAVTVGGTTHTYVGATPTAGFSPVLDAKVHTYTISGVPAGTITALMVTPTASTNAAIVVNDQAVTGASVGLVSQDLSSSSPYNVVITVTAQDGMTTNSYKVRITT